MKKLANLLVAVSILLVAYFLIAKFTGQTIINWYSVRARATPGLILATFLMLIAIFIKLSIKEGKGFIIHSAFKRKILFLVGSLVITGLLLRLLWFYDQKVIERFHQIYYYSAILDQTKWLGIHSSQNPCDNWVMQEIISEVKPDFIIETGTAYGGTTLFYATVLEKVNKNGKVITIDIEPQVGEASKFNIFKERVEVIKSDSVSPELNRGC